jgi:REP-associated tyrosine transposase
LTFSSTASNNAAIL